MQEVEEEGRGPGANAAATEQRAYLQHLFASEARSLPWKDVLYNVEHALELWNYVCLQVFNKLG
ncbi:hypothetical protein DPMN_141063 [Dreissena polymorpha]|uniref:Uncharacterized protein n=1 Tax=Dreissena polymorpha TaxID=45954 RepID=A0A9D4GEQ0_DREPO|nr:hypothetical protein DPMN_141063 [Dreissena polymorpha]